MQFNGFNPDLAEVEFTVLKQIEAYARNVFRSPGTRKYADFVKSVTAAHKSRELYPS